MNEFILVKNPLFANPVPNHLHRQAILSCMNWSTLWWTCVSQAKSWTRAMASVGAASLTPLTLTYSTTGTYCMSFSDVLVCLFLRIAFVGTCFEWHWLPIWDLRRAEVKGSWWSWGRTLTRWMLDFCTFEHKKEKKNLHFDKVDGRPKRRGCAPQRNEKGMYEQVNFNL